jgi:hypothetical protein
VIKVRRIKFTTTLSKKAVEDLEYVKTEKGLTSKSKAIEYLLNLHFGEDRKYDNRETEK